MPEMHPDEQVITCFTITVFGNRDQLREPSGSGEESDAAYSSVSELLGGQQLSNQLNQLFGDNAQKWGLRTEVQRIA